MTTVKIKFRASSQLDKAGMLFYQIIHNRVTRQLYTGSKLFPNEWDATESKIVIPSDCNAGRNGYLSSLREELEAGVSRLSGIIARLFSPCLFSFLAYFKCYLVSHTNLHKISEL